ncbi:S-adenosyl-L-methionine-dependent methyltransferase [Apodospora peruviana]|uniref:Protein-lysine N-methyltransferase EFM4 n=1 Tax=Apodospora peruviana TaxID=516989 RepID=A0AAE0LZN5_9PEZI|nr:S-adenosyl-L-methionine-dependent methyltransferase [Apodospora peruviana]
MSSDGAAPAGVKPTHLDPSPLGTKQYWDNLYKTEISNHADNPTDEGTVWFDDSDAQAKIVEFLDDNYDHLKPCASVIDLGCGNGSLPFALREDGWTGRLLGVDYSELSIKLATQLQSTRRQEEDDCDLKEVEFKTWDLLKDDPQSLQEEGGGWDVVLDKGTFDAISLSEEKDAQTGRPICEGYADKVVRIMKTGAIFLVTSCNWTETELKGWFEADTYADGNGNQEKRVKLRQVGRVEYRTYEFGGVKGQTISSVCFVKEEI